jgi:MYXO-CTERM domain-containing protein
MRILTVPPSSTFAACAVVVLAALSSTSAQAQCLDRRTGVDSCEAIIYDDCSCGATAAGADPCNWFADAYCDAPICASAGFSFAEDPADCPVGCGDGFCDVDEALTCPSDCTVGCGDGFCDIGEDQTCPGDCGVISFCNGDGICDSGEDPAFCADCNGDVGTTSRTCIPSASGPPKSFADASGAGAGVEVCGGGFCKTSQLSISVVDRNCNPVTGVNVNWRVVSGGGSIVRNGNGRTDNLGIAYATWNAGTTAGMLVFEASAGGVSNSPAQFEVFALSGPATTIVVGGLPNPIVAAAPQGFEVTMRDVFGNVASDYEGTVEFSSSDPLAVLPSPAPFTFFDGGVLPFAGALTLNTVGAQTFTVRDVANPALTTTTNVTVERRLLSATAGSAQAGTVGTALANPLSVRYLRSDGVTPIVGAVVTFAARDGGAVSATTVTTNAQGIASTNATLGTLAGAQRFTATADGLVVEFTATAVAGPATSLRLTSASSSTIAGEPIDLTLLARDGFGNVATTYAGTVAFASSDPGASLPSTVTFSAGDAGRIVLPASAMLRSAGAFAVTARDTAAASLTTSLTFDVFAAAPSALVAVGGEAQVGLAGEALSLPLVVRLQDAFGNAVAGAAVAFSVVDGAGSVATPATTTDEDGIAASEVALGNVAGVAQTFRATAAGLDVLFAATAVPGPASALVLFGVPANAQAGVAQSVRVEARDRHGNLAVEHAATIAFSSTDAAASFPAPTSFAGAAGVLEFPQALVLRTAGAQRVVVGDGVLSTQAEVAVASAAPTTIVVVDGDAQSAVVASTLPTPIVVRVVDAFENGVAGVALSWSPVAGGSITSTSTTDEAGRATATASLGTVAGANPFVVRAGLLETTVTATARAAAVDRLVVQAPAAAFTEERTLIAIEARDAFDNVAVDYVGTVTVATSDATAVLPAPIAFSAGAAGRAVVEVTFNAVGAHTVSAADDAGRSGTSSAVAVAERPPVPSALFPVVGDAQRGTAGTPYATPLELIVKDARGRVVPGAEVAFAVVAGNASLVADRVVADGVGVVRATVVAGTQAGSERVRASLANAPDVGVVFDLTSVPGPVAGVTATVPVATVQDCTPAMLLFVARDAWGNVATEPVDVVVDVAALTGTPVIVSTTLLASGSGGASTNGALVGTAQVEVQLDAAADVFVTWSVPSLGLGGSEPVTFVTGPVSVSASRVVADATLARGGGDPVVVTVSPVDDCGVAVGEGLTVTAAASYGTMTAVEAVGEGAFAASFHVGASECRVEPATIVFYVDGVLLDERVSLPTECPEPTGPRITTVPRAAAIVGVPYIVDGDRSFDADGGLARWIKVEGPESFRVDPVTGFVGWVPSRAGTETIRVAANNDAGHAELAFTVAVAASAGAPPVAVVDVSPASAPVGTVVRASASGSQPGAGGPIVTTTWTFGDGSPAVTGIEQTHRYERAGSHVVRAEVVDESGVTAEAATIVSSTGEGGTLPPRARILSTPIEQGEGRLVTELACDCTAGSAPIAAVQWDFGDGTIADADVVTQVFGPGGWTVRLTVLDDNGLLASDTIAVDVAGSGNRAPLVTAGASPTSGAAPLLVSFSGRYGDLDGVIDAADVHWDFGDGGSSNERSPTYTFNEPGIYRVALTVVDDAGLSTTGTLDIEVTSGDIAAPRILSVPSTTARVGEPYAYDADGRAAARGSRPMTWALGKRVGDTLVGAPAGMVVDAFSGAVTFTPTAEQAGRQRVVLVAWNDAGTTSQEWDIDVVGGIGEPPPPPPPGGGPNTDGGDDRARDVSAAAGCNAGAGSTADAASWALLMAGVALLRRRRRA